ncbi:unnamed protein product [Cercospora beticola]|nr:unnamed protein product [Cercospora beticola]
MDTYSIPDQARQLLYDGILNNRRQTGLPAEIDKCAAVVTFEGSPLPSIPINWRFAESMAALKAMEAAMINVLLGRKYNSDPLPAVINTDHAQLLFMSSLVLTVDPGAEFQVTPTPVRELSAKYSHHFPLQDVHNMASSLYRRAATNIYKTADDRFIHLHGSLNPGPTIAALGLPPDRPELDNLAASYQPYIDKCMEFRADALETLLNEQAKQACTIANTWEAYRDSAHGRANADVNLFEVHHRPVENQAPCWWSSAGATATLQRPLAGLKIVDLTRVIAGPSISRGLAELGASVMRATAPHLPDFTGLHPDLNWGKWNCCLDLRQAEDREKLRKLIQEADVVVDGYRPGVFDKYGFGMENVLEQCRERKFGVIYARENSYGWKGEWQHRSGWQPISDANTGISFGFGRAMGHDEPVTPVFPNSDYCTGVAGCVGVLQALIQRAERGGSFVVDIALNYYNAWLARQCGEYPPAVWEDVLKRNGGRAFRHFQSMNVTVPAYLGMIQANAANTLFRPEFFERRRSGALGLDMQVVRPGIRFPKDTVELRYNVGTRGNGVDSPFWPRDLSVEVVEEDTEPSPQLS